MALVHAAVQCAAAEAANLLLRAIEADDGPGLSRALDCAARICRGPWPDSDAEERAELLEAVVKELRKEPGQKDLAGSFDTHATLLRHLAEG